MTSLAQKLTDIVGDAFEAQGLPRALGLVRVSDRPDLAQFQCNGAMAAAKQVGKNPREVAQGVVNALASNPDFSSLEIAGPGFININVTDEFLAAHLGESAHDERLGVEIFGEGTVILDYGGPNPAKAMHVGHLRSTIIGDALKRILDFAGYEALGDVHLNDLGLPMGQIISEFEIRHSDWVYFDRGYNGAYPDSPPFTYAELEQIYPEASNACKADAARLEKAKQATVELQDRTHPGYIAMWQQFMILSKADMKRNFDSLGVHFELWRGEADIYGLIAPMAEDLKARSIALESDGAVVIPVDEESDKKEMPPLMFYKSDGAVTYGTTDLATIYDRVKIYGDALEQIIYAVDKRQNLHFEQVFRAAHKAGYVQEDKLALTHVGYGTLNGPDGKPFKTRDGGVMRLDQLVSMAISKAEQRIVEAELAQDMEPDEREDIAHKIGIAAIKFADLQNQPQSDYIFDLDRMTQFEGKTGPYLLYQAVRIGSLMRKAAEQGLTPGDDFIIEEADRKLALLLTELPDHFEMALKNYTPHVLCDYAFKLAQVFSSFYGSCHILSEENEALRASRLALCDLTQRQLMLVLGLLGIEIPTRM